MDLNEHLSKIVEGLLKDITANVNAQVDSYVSNAIQNKLASYDFSEHIQRAASSAFEKRVAEYTIDPKKLENRIVEKINTTIESVQANAGILVSNAISSKIAASDFQHAMNVAVSTVVSDRIKEFVFPEKSIHANAINYSESTVSGDAIRGGIIREFSSTGIDDRATNVALTILDAATVVENNLLTKDLTVQGSMVINGDFVVNGNVPSDSKFYQDLINSASASTLGKLDNTLFSMFSNTIFNSIRNDGIDLNKITINGKEVIKDNSLGTSIVSSNLQSLGILKELQVGGEAILSQTLYVTPKRVGVNTIEPSAALSVWDDEVEIVTAKRQKDTGVFGTTRQQKLILSANNKDNIMLDTDGSIHVSDIRLGQHRFTSADKPPNYVSSRGHIVWNSNPNPGGPIGWVCLGAANWANFGIID